MQENILLIAISISQTALNVEELRMKSCDASVVSSRFASLTDFLVNLTNDGWFGEGAAQWQHAAAAVFRAVENGVPLLRCSNNGLTCWVDEHGRIRQLLRTEGGSVYGAGVMRAEIPIRAAAEKHAPTFYRTHGDWFGWACVVITVIGTVRRIRASRTEVSVAAPSV